MANGIVLHQQINIFKLHSIESLCKDLDLRLLPIRPEDRNTPLGILAATAASPQPQPTAAASPQPQPGAAASLQPQPWAAASLQPQPGAAASEAHTSKPDPDAREMLVFCGLTPDLLDRFLEEYHRREIAPVELKAVLTAHNAKWTPKKLQTELIKEHRL